jgi:hypothetical protein
MWLLSIHTLDRIESTVIGYLCRRQYAADVDDDDDDDFSKFDYTPETNLF